MDRLIEFKEISVLDKMRGLSILDDQNLQFFTAAIAKMSCKMNFDVRLNYPLIRIFEPIPVLRRGPASVFQCEDESGSQTDCTHNKQDKMRYRVIDNQKKA